MLNKISNKIVMAVGTVLILLINVANITYYNPGYWPFRLSFFRIVVLSVIFIVATLCGIYVLRLLAQHVTEKWLFWVLLIAMIIRLIWAMAVPTPPVQDYLQLHNASVAFAQGHTDFARTNYYVNFSPYMVGFVLYQGFVIKLFGDSILLLKILNCFFSVLTIWFIAKIADKLFGEKAAVLSAIIMAVYIPNIAAVSVLTNNILAVCLFMLGIMILVLRPINLKTGVLAGAAIFAGNFIRPLSAIIIIAVILYILFIDLPKAGSKKTVLTGLISFLVCFSVLAVGSDKVLHVAKISEQSTISTNTNWKLALGLNAKTNGMWNFADYQYVTKAKSPKTRNERAGKLVSQRINQPAKLTKLFIHKFAIMWGDIDSMISWGTKNSGVPRVVVASLCVVQKVMYMCITLAAGVAVSRNKGQSAQLLLILLIGYILIHLGIEIQTRYRYFAMPLLVILASASLTSQAENHRISNRNKT